MQGPGSVAHQGFWLCFRAITAKGFGAAFHPQHRPGSRRIYLDCSAWDYGLWMPLGVQHKHCSSTQDSKAASITTADHQILAGIAQPEPKPKPFHAASQAPCSNLYTAAVVASSCPSKSPVLPAMCVRWGSVAPSASHYLGPQTCPVKELKASSAEFKFKCMTSPHEWTHKTARVFLGQNFWKPSALV